MSKKEFGFLMICFILLALYYLQLPRSKRSISFHDEGIFIQDYAFSDLNGDGFVDIIAYTPETQQTFFLDGKKNSKRVLNLTLEHPRGFAHCDLDGDGINDLLIADHGDDHPPFRGGESFIIWGDKERKFEFSKLNKQKAYSFSVSCLGKEVYLSNSGNPQLPTSMIYDFNSAKNRDDYFQYSFAPLLGENGFFPNKFLASLMIDLNDDGKRDLILGKEQESTNKDLIFWGKAETFDSHPTLFPRKERSTWATVDIDAVRVNDQVDSVLLVSHNPDMSEGVVEQWKKSENEFHLQHVFRPSKDIQGEFWIPWISTGDLNGDGRDDLSFAVWGSEEGFLGPRFYIYYNLSSGWKDARNRFLAGPFSSVREGDYWNRVEILDFDGDGKKDLLFLDFEGNGHLY